MEHSTDNIIKLAWSDKVSFEKIERLHGKNESEVIKIMRQPMVRQSNRDREEENICAPTELLEAARCNGE